LSNIVSLVSELIVTLAHQRFCIPGDVLYAIICSKCESWWILTGVTSAKTMHKTPLTINHQKHQSSHSHAVDFRVASRAAAVVSKMQEQ
jgi:hypothetical protein